MMDEEGDSVAVMSVLEEILASEEGLSSLASLR